MDKAECGLEALVSYANFTVPLMLLQPCARPFISSPRYICCSGENYPEIGTAASDRFGGYAYPLGYREAAIPGYPLRPSYDHSRLHCSFAAPPTPPYFANQPRVPYGYGTAESPENREYTEDIELCMDDLFGSPPTTESGTKESPVAAGPHSSTQFSSKPSEMQLSVETGVECESRRRVLEDKEEDHELERLLNMFDVQESTPTVTMSMEHKSDPGLKAEGISPQSLPSTSAHPSPSYRDVFLPSAPVVHQYPMQNVFPGFDLPRASFGGQPSELMPPPFAAQSFMAPSFIETPQSLPMTGHHDVGPMTGSFPFHGGVVSQSTASDSRRGSQGTISSGSTSSLAGTPSPLAQPTSPLFGPPPSLMRFSMLGEQFGVGVSGIQASASASASSDTMHDEKLCAVCSDRAVCQHYGARTCEGCKGFFKRTVQKKAQYVCTGNKNCTIDKRFRSRCQYCRYQKCIAVGMVKEVVRYGSLSGRRGRLPSKTKAVHTDEPPSPPLPLLTLLSKALADSKIISSDFPAFEGTLEELLIALEEQLRSLLQFVGKIPGASELSLADIVSLAERNFFPILALKLCNRSRERGSGGSCEDLEMALPRVPAPFKMFFSQVHEEALRFQAVLQWDSISFAALLALLFLNTADSSSDSLSSEAAIERLRGTITSALKDHCCGSSPQHSKRLQTIISQVEVFANFQQHGQEALSACLASGVELPPQLSGVARHAHHVAASLKMDFGEFSFCQ